MKLINQKAELLIQQDWKKQIEIAARTCYKSEDKIAEGTADKMLEKLINSKHYAMLEHGTIYLYVDGGLPVDIFKLSYMFKKYYENPYSRVKWNRGDPYLTVTTNYRVIKEHGWGDDLRYLCDPTGNHVKRYTFRLTTSIGIVRELLRHRVFSFANESTRYVNYNKKEEFCFIKPYWFENDTKGYIEELLHVCENSIQAYTTLINTGLPPQAAREVLPLCTKSELIMTGFEDDWKDFLNVRFKGTTGRPHPDMVELAEKINSALCAEVLANSKPIQILLQNEYDKSRENKHT